MRPHTVQSLLDLDLYKLTQQQFFWENYPSLKVKYQFNNWLVKLSDNLNKHIGPSDSIYRYSKAFNYTNIKSEKLIV